MDFAPSFFEHLSDRLELAVFDTNQEYRMDYGFRGSPRPNPRPSIEPPVASQPEPALTSEPTPLPAVSFNQEKPSMSTNTGASFLANLIRTRQAKVKEQLAQAGNELNAVMDDMEATADAATKQVSDAKAEVADLKAALGMNSNGEPA